MRFSAAAEASLAISLALLAASPGQAQGVRTVARVIASSEVEGRFAHPVCYQGETLRPADEASYTYALVRTAGDPDRPLVIDTGGLTALHGVARYAAERQPRELAELVSALGYRALAFGRAELDSPRADVISVARALGERGIPMLASNLRCDEGADELCEVVVDAGEQPPVLEVGERRVAVLAVVREDALSWIAPDRARGLTVEPPAIALARLTSVARAGGAQVVVAVVDAGVEGGVIDFAASLPEDARPDLLFVSGGSELLFARPRSVHPVVVGAPENDAIEVLIRDSDAIREGYEMLAQPLEGRGITAARPVLDFIDAVGPGYCDTWGRGGGGGGGPPRRPVRGWSGRRRRGSPGSAGSSWCHRSCSCHCRRTARRGRRRSRPRRAVRRCPPARRRCSCGSAR